MVGDSLFVIDKSGELRAQVSRSENDFMMSVIGPEESTVPKAIGDYESPMAVYQGKLTEVQLKKLIDKAFYQAGVPSEAMTRATLLMFMAMAVEPSTRSGILEEKARGALAVVGEDGGKAQNAGRILSKEIAKYVPPRGGVIEL